MHTKTHSRRRNINTLTSGVYYGVALFLAGLIFGTLRTLFVTPTLGRATAVLIELPFMFLTAWLVSRYLMRQLSIKPIVSDRLAVSLAAFIAGMGLELIFGIAVLGQTFQEIATTMFADAGRIGLLGQVFVFLFPVIQLGWRPVAPPVQANSDDESQWWTMPLAQTFSALSSSATGLSSREATQRLQKYGANEIEAEATLSIPRLIFDRLREPLALLLLGAAALSAVTGDATSFGLIVTMILIGVVLDVVQEYRASKAAGLLRDQVGMQEEVFRDGKEVIIPADAIVTGDVVRLSGGDVVPADGLIISATGFCVNEASLTGEPYPVIKAAGDDSAPRAASLATNAVFRGVPVTSGTATYLVTRTGRNTQIGQLAGKLRAPAPLGALERGTKAFGFLVLRVTIGLVFVVLIAHTFAGRPFIESLMFALALAVGMTPELLPMVTSVTLSRGAIRLAKQNVIVKRLAAIHDLGAMDILCTDKTGTLTQANITFAQAIGAKEGDAGEVLLLAHLNSTFSHGVESPLDKALKTAMTTPKDWQGLSEVPFDFDRRRVSVLVQHGDETLMITKGAPDETLAICGAFGMPGAPSVPADKKARHHARELVDIFGAKGERALAVAWKVMPRGTTTCTLDDERGMSFAGYVTFVDPPKPSASQALKDLSALGVSVMILTGDSKPVTLRVCEQLGFTPTSVLEGDQISKLDGAGLAAAIRGANVFCRLNPVQKNRIVLALKRAGHVVGYIGDGINDTTALHDADVGLSVDGAVDVAREAADIILLQPDLAILVDGVREGRRTFSNIMKYIMMAVSSNFGNMLSMAGAALFLPYLPMTALQILLNNLIYDVASTAIPFDQVDDQDVARPRTWDIGHITRFMLTMGPVSSVFDVATFVILTRVFHADEPGFQSAWFTQSLLTQVLVVLVIRTRQAPWKSAPHRFMLMATAGAAALAFIIPYSPLGTMFGLVAIPMPMIFAILGLTLSYLIAAEVAKRAFYQAEARRHLPPVKALRR
jgi:P-type Mg2+ transporter